MKRREKRSLIILGLMIMTIAAVSCGPSIGALSPFDQTLTPMNLSVQGTVTARAGQSNDNQDLATAIAKATAEAINVYSTQTALGDLNSPSRLATSTAIAPVVAELPKYGVDPADGYVAWLHPPVTIDLKGFQQTGFANNFQNITGANLVMAADITWHTFNSASGCGFMFRSNGDTNQPSQYNVLISRVSSGQAAFLALVNGKVANYHSFFPKDKDKSFNWFNDGTNHLAVVARGNIIDIYTNYELIGEVDASKPPSQTISSPPKPELPEGANNAQLQDLNDQLAQTNSGMDSINAQLGQAKQNFDPSTSVLTDGFLGFIGLSQSGTMTCKFENAWLFNLVK